MTKIKKITYSKFYSIYKERKLSKHTKEVSSVSEYLMSNKRLNDTINKVILNEIRNKSYK